MYVVDEEPRGIGPLEAVGPVHDEQNFLAEAIGLDGLVGGVDQLIEALGELREVVAYRLPHFFLVGRSEFDCAHEARKYLAD